MFILEDEGKKSNERVKRNLRSVLTVLGVLVGI